MKQFLSIVLALLMILSVMTCASAENSLSGYSDDQLKQLYELVKEEMGSVDFHSPRRSRSAKESSSSARTFCPEATRSSVLKLLAIPTATRTPLSAGSSAATWAV